MSVCVLEQSSYVQVTRESKRAAMYYWVAHDDWLIGSCSVGHPQQQLHVAVHALKQLMRYAL
jgi:hypothetical protein